MKDIEVQRILLKRLYDLDEESRGSAWDVWSVAGEIGLNDCAQVGDMARRLYKKGLIEIIEFSVSGPIVKITPEGREYMEEIETREVEEEKKKKKKMGF